MLDELLIHGMRIAALEVIGKAGDIAGSKAVKKYSGDEKAIRIGGKIGSFGSSTLIKITSDK